MTISLSEAIKMVRQENLTKSQLEDYHNQMSLLLAELQIEASELEREEALFLANRSQEESVISVKVRWKVTQGGQRLIVVKRYISAVKTLLGSIKNKLYVLY